MHRLELQRLNVEFELLIARRRAAQYLPFSPAWDAAMAQVEDLAREAWRLEQSKDQPATELVAVPGPLGRIV